MQVLLADNHELVRFALSEVMRQISSDVDIVECSNFEEAIDAASDIREKLDLIVVDVVMPGMTLGTGVEQLLSRYPNTPVVVLSGHFTTRDAEQVLKVGAAGFIPKTLGMFALRKAIELVLSGQKFAPPELLIGGGATTTNKKLGRYSGFGNLSGRQQQVLNELIGGLANKEIARRLEVTEATIKLHVSAILKKLGAGNRTEAVRLALQNGWGRSFTHAARDTTPEG